MKRDVGVAVTIKAIETPLGRLEYCIEQAKDAVNEVCGHLRVIGVLGDGNYSVRIPLGIVGLKSLPALAYDEVGFYIGHYTKAHVLELVVLSVEEGAIVVARGERGPTHVIGDEALHTFTWKGIVFTVRRAGDTGTLSFIQIRH